MLMSLWLLHLFSQLGKASKPTLSLRLAHHHINLKVKLGNPPPGAEDGTKTGKAQDFFCLVSKTPIPRSYVSEQAKAGKLGMRLLAIVLKDHEAGYTFLRETISNLWLSLLVTHHSSF